MEKWDVHLMEVVFSHVFVAMAMPKSSETKVHCWLKMANKSAGILVGTFSTSASDTMRLLHHILSSATDRLPHCSSALQKQNVKVFIYSGRKQPHKARGNIRSQELFFLLNSCCPHSFLSRLAHWM